MTTEDSPSLKTESEAEGTERAPPRKLTPAAARALAEAQERRRNVCVGPRELNGRKGPDPVRYGDWEVNGIASDF